MYIDKNSIDSFIMALYMHALLLILSFCHMDFDVHADVSEGNQKYWKFNT